jgi:arylsulfatase
MHRPNILLIMTDQLRYDAIGKTGGWVNTPNIDRIAEEGMLFTQCLTNSPVCIPARVSLATGLYPHNTGICKNVNDYDMPVHPTTWMQALQSAGYRTSLFGKTHLHHHGGDLRDREHLMHAYGFDDMDEIGGPRASMHVRSHMTEQWEQLGLLQAYIDDYKERYAKKPYMAKPSSIPLEHYADVYVGRKACEYLEAYDRDQPWFSMVSFGGPHEPWDAPEPYASMYDPKQMPKRLRRPDRCIDRSFGQLDILMSKDNPHSPVMSEEEIASMRANYAGNVTLIDDQIGAILSVLERRGELDQTVIVFTSDHGEMNGDFGLIYKENFLNGSIRVPLIVRTPDTRGSICDEMIELFDVGPTIVELAGVQWTGTHYARSLVPVIQMSTTAKHRKEALVEVHGEYLLQDQQWKLALNRDGEPYLLYNLLDDPNELNNLISDPAHRTIVDRLQIRLLQRLATSQFMR